MFRSSVHPHSLQHGGGEGADLDAHSTRAEIAWVMRIVSCRVRVVVFLLHCRPHHRGYGSEVGVVVECHAKVQVLEPLWICRRYPVDRTPQLNDLGI